MKEYDLTKYEIKEFFFEDKPALVDVSVLILFFNRPDHVRQVFEQVKKARPSRLFLYQDGARKNNKNDEINIAKCRKIVSEIDWSCTVYIYFQTENYGCDPSEYISQKWAFSISDKCIVLEDDDVPCISFFRFCKELLDKYEDDKRIYRISGQNILGEYNPYDADYFFTKGGSIWGWASWKRVIDEWDPDYTFLSDSRIVDGIMFSYSSAGVKPKKFINTCAKHKKSGTEYYESIFFSSRILGSGLTIVPSKNMISNIGISAEATHGGTNIKLFTKNVQKAFYAPTYELTGSIKHPRYVLEDKRYEVLQSKMMGWRNNIFQKVATVIEERIRSILYR